jgi:hypothetical protein
MRITRTLILVVQAALVILLTVAVAAKWMPLGIPGEWEWLRTANRPTWLNIVLSSLGLCGFLVVVIAGWRALGSHKAGVRVEGLWLGGLFVAAVVLQVAIPIGAPEGYGLEKWAAVNFLPSSTGYYQVARRQAAADPWRFFAEYPEWIKSQDSLHIGTHPPGLIAVQCMMLWFMDNHPNVVEFLFNWMPAPVDLGFRVFSNSEPVPPSRADRAALYLTAILTLLLCSGTVVPLYLLARATLPARAAWAAAVLWPPASAANLFQPSADTTYPLLSASALALACWAARLQNEKASLRGVSLLAAFFAGAVMAPGMACTLAFLPVGLIVGLTIAFQPSLTWTQRGVLILAVGIGFLVILSSMAAITGVNPLPIASWNLHHHARFYDEYPRTYWYWFGANPLELVIAIGLPSVVWCAVGLAHRKSVPPAVWATLIVLCLVNLIGRNLGEVARLWMLFTPPFLVASAVGLTRLGGNAATVGVTTALVGLQTLALQSFIQVVYPV